ncbi:hypothetical protein AABB24_018482, partial [Solanum stoloniferum]
MCHVPMKVLRKIPMFQNLNKNVVFALNNCEVCPLARQTRLPFPHSMSRSTSSFQLLHIDVWGPYKWETFDGMRYFLTIVDDHTRWTWFFLMRLKSDVLMLLKNFFNEVETQFGKKVQRLRSDNGGEFYSHACTELFQHYGIVHESSCPYTPQQNGVVERRHRHILETARAVKFQSGLPSRFWGLCIEAAVYILNRIPSTVLNGRSPFQLLYNKLPSLLHLRVIGCLCFATTLIQKDKFSPRAVRAVLVGYSSHQKGYKLYDLENKSFFVSRDVVFMETIFPFQNDLQNDKEDVSTTNHFSYDDLVTFIPISLRDEPVIAPLGSPSMEGSQENDVSDPIPAIVNVNENNAANIRRSARGSRPPIWHKDFVLQTGSKKCLHSIANHVDYTGLSSKYQSFVANFSTETEPASYSEAASDARWQHAMKCEVQALEDNNTWKIVSLPQGKKAIGCRWVYKIK